jgi:hypothetical protein
MNDVERQLKDEESVKKIDIDYMTHKKLACGLLFQIYH